MSAKAYIGIPNENDDYREPKPRLVQKMYIGVKELDENGYEVVKPRLINKAYIGVKNNSNEVEPRLFYASNKKKI